MSENVQYEKDAQTGEWRAFVYLDEAQQMTASGKGATRDEALTSLARCLDMLEKML